MTNAVVNISLILLIILDFELIIYVNLLFLNMKMEEVILANIYNCSREMIATGFRRLILEWN